METYFTLKLLRLREENNVWNQLQPRLSGAHMGRAQVTKASQI